MRGGLLKQSRSRRGKTDQRMHQLNRSSDRVYGGAIAFQRVLEVDQQLSGARSKRHSTVYILCLLAVPSSSSSRKQKVWDRKKIPD